MEQQRNKNGTMERYAAMDIRAVDGEGKQDDARTFTLSFSSEEPYTRWFGPEILDHTGTAVDLERLKEIGVVLFNHDRDRVLGKINRAWIEDNRGMAEITFDSDADAETIRQKVSCGTLKGVSVGYRVSNWEEVEAGATSIDGRFSGPCSIARQWMPYEISIVSVPADPSVGVGRDYEPEGGTAQNTTGAAARSLNELQLQINLNYLKGENQK